MDDPAHVEAVPDGRGGTPRVTGHLRKVALVPAAAAKTMTEGHVALAADADLICTLEAWQSWPYLYFPGDRTRRAQGQAWRSVLAGCPSRITWYLELWRPCAAGQLRCDLASSGLIRTYPGQKHTAIVGKLCKGTKATTWATRADGLTPYYGEAGGFGVLQVIIRSAALAGVLAACSALAGEPSGLPDGVAGVEVVTGQPQGAVCVQVEHEDDVRSLWCFERFPDPAKAARRVEGERPILVGLTTEAVEAVTLGGEPVWHGEPVEGLRPFIATGGVEGELVVTTAQGDFVVAPEAVEPPADTGTVIIEGG